MSRRVCCFFPYVAMKPKSGPLDTLNVKSMCCRSTATFVCDLSVFSGNLWKVFLEDGIFTPLCKPGKV